MVYKVVGHMTAFNAMQFLPLTVRKIAECVDLLLIAESSVPSLQHTADKNGLSSDGTSEYLEELAKDVDNIECFHLGEVPDLRHSRNAMLINTPEDTDFIMKLDSDEVFWKYEYDQALSILPPDTIGMSNHFHFWKDSKHIITSKKESHWNNWKPRFVPFKEDIRYRVHDDFTSIYHDTMKCWLRLRIYHFSWMAHRENIIARLVWHNMTSEGFTDLVSARAHALKHFYFTGKYNVPIYTMDRGIGIEIKQFDELLPIKI